jgi:predicted helicase
MSEVYNQTVRSYAALRQKPAVDDFVSNDDHKISWSRDLKADLMRGKEAEFDEQKIRKYAYRPFANQFVFFDRILNEEVRRWPSFLPLSVSDGENSFICVSAIGNPKPFHTLMTDCLTDLHLTADSQCFPFYTYDEDGSHRRENITDWALGEFRERMKDEGGRMKEGKGKGKEEGERMKDEGGGMKEGKGKGKVEGGGMKDEGKKGKEKKPSSFSLHPSSLLTKWDIFYYVYGLLHHPEYRTKYAANLRRELPRIPISPDFWAFSEAGKKLADLHVGYESVKEYPLEQVWRPGAGLNLRVEKMKLKKPTMTPSENAVIARNPGGVTKQSVGVTADDKGLLRRPKGTPRNDGSTGMASIVYNADLTLTGIPPEAFEYRLGNRSAIDWIIDQYQVSTDKRSGITNDPNREDDKMYIVELIGKVVTVSLETVRIVGEIRKLALG